MKKRVYCKPTVEVLVLEAGALMATTGPASTPGHPGAAPRKMGDFIG